MHQTTVANSLSEPLPEIEIKTSDMGELVEIIKGEEVGAALQVVLNYLEERITARVLAKLGKPSLVFSEPTIVSPAQPDQPRKKREMSPETKEKISKSQKACWGTRRKREVSPETKEKISKSQSRRWATRKGDIATPRESSTPTEADCQPQHNNLDEVTTAVAVPVEAQLAMREGYAGDPFYISADGHFIGNDGFVVPKDFNEFHERFPRYIESWVRRRLGGYGVEEDIEDWCQELIIHMKWLPATSKHRALGKEDVVQTFDPFAQYGATERRWRSYMNYVLANKYNTIHGKKAKNPICRPGNTSIVSETTPDSHGEGTDEYIYSKSDYFTEATSREEKKQEDRFFTNKFIDFVREADPEVSPVLEAVYVAGSSTDTIKEFCQTCKRLATTKEVSDGEHANHEIGLTPKEFNRARNKLKQLAAQFVKKK